MKKTVVMLLTVVFMLSMLGVFASAESYSNEIVSFEVPEIFSSKTENSIDGADYIQWMNPETNSNISLTTAPNEPKVCYADLTEAQMQVLRATFVASLEKETKELLEAYSIEFKILDSKARQIDLNGVKGTRIDVDVQYLQPDSTTENASMISYLFSSDDTAITMNALVKTQTEREAVDEMIESMTVRLEIYKNSNSSIAYTVVKAAVILVAVVGIIVIAVSSKKKKKQKLTSQTQPVQTQENGTSSVLTDHAQPDGVVYDCAGISPDFIDPDNTQND